MKSCRGCGIEEYVLTPSQTKKKDYLCFECRSEENRCYRKGLSSPDRGYREREIQPTLDRVMSHVLKTETCWLWQGAKAKGYGITGTGRRSGRQRGAHEVIYELLVGPIPQGRELDHLCRIRNCVRPDHLEPVTHRVNTLRGNAPNAISVRTGKCYRGHPLTIDNTYIRQNKRHCQICRKATRERWRERASNSA